MLIKILLPSQIWVLNRRKKYITYYNVDYIKYVYQLKPPKSIQHHAYNQPKDMAVVLCPCRLCPHVVVVVEARA